MKISNSIGLSLFAALFVLFIASLVYRPLLYLLVGLILIMGMLLLLFVMSKQKPTTTRRPNYPGSGGSSPLPSASNRPRGGSSGSSIGYGTGAEPRAASSGGSDTQTALLIVALIIGLIVIAVGG